MRLQWFTETCWCLLLQVSFNVNTSYNILISETSYITKHESALYIGIDVVLLRELMYWVIGEKIFIIFFLLDTHNSRTENSQVMKFCTQIGFIIDSGISISHSLATKGSSCYHDNQWNPVCAYNLTGITLQHNQTWYTECNPHALSMATTFVAMAII